MNLGTRFMEAYHGLVGKTHKPLWQRTLLTTIHGAIALWRAALQDQLFVRAATLSFWTLVAIVPVLALAFSLMGPLGLLDNVAVKLKDLLYSTVLAASVAEVGPWLDGLVSGIKLETLGVAGFLGVLVAGSKMYSSVEQAYNDIFRVRLRRRWLLRITLFYAVVTLGPLLLSMGFAATTSMMDGMGMLGRAVPVLLTTSAFVLAIKLVPHTEVRWQAALAGGFSSAVLFEALKTGFSAYTELLGAANTMVRLYGSLALFPVFLFYIYLLWLVVLLGVEVAYVVHYARPLLADERDRLRMGDIWRRRPDPFFGLQVMIALAQHYVGGKGPISEHQLGELLGAPNRSIHDALDVLEAGELVVRIENGRYLPAKPLSTLTGSQVIRCCRDVSVPSCDPQAPGAGAVQASMDAISHTLDTSIIDLAQACPPEPTESIAPGEAHGAAARSSG